MSSVPSWWIRHSDKFQLSHHTSAVKHLSLSAGLNRALRLSWPFMRKRCNSECWVLLNRKGIWLPDSILWHSSVWWCKRRPMISHSAASVWVDKSHFNKLYAFRMKTIVVSYDFFPNIPQVLILPTFMQIVHRKPKNFINRAVNSAITLGAETRYCNLTMLNCFVKSLPSLLVWVGLWRL